MTQALDAHLARIRALGCLVCRRFVSTGEPGADDFDLKLVDGAVEGDHIVVVHGASVFIDPVLAPAVADSVLDAVLDEDGVRFGFVDHDDVAHEHFHGE